MTADVAIRLAKSGDETAILACAELAYVQYVADIGQKPAPMLSDFAALIASEYVHVAVGKAGGLLGFIVFFQKGDSFFLDSVGVNPTAAGQGIGKRLITFCETQAQTSGARYVKLYTNEKMTRNLSMYPYLGYRETARKTQDGFHRVYFEKAL